jgi:pimeloyl-ACP methyl ester carboxylesterase
MITVLVCRGIGDGAGEHGLLWACTRLLDPLRFRVREVHWSATYGPVGGGAGSPALDVAVAAGERALLDAIRHDPYPVVVLGYSGGALVAGNVAARLKAGEFGDLDVRCVCLVADPARPALPSSWSGSGPGTGIAGARPWFPFTEGPRVVWVSNPGDVICCCPTDSPLRRIADLSSSWSLIDPLTWFFDLANRVSTNRWQDLRANPLAAWSILARYRQARLDAEGYLLRGEHTRAYDTRPAGAGATRMEALAAMINAEVW